MLASLASIPYSRGMSTASSTLFVLRDPAIRAGSSAGLLRRPALGLLLRFAR